MPKIALAAALVAAALPAQAQSVKAGIDAWQHANYSTAVGIWRPLAESGDADAAFNLGQAYRLGRGVPINLAAAQTWFERAARKGHVDAQTTLGLLLFDTGNRTGGIRWLKSAAEQGEPRALLIYGTALFNGDAVARDPVLAYAYVSRVAAQGLAAAKTTLSEMNQMLPLEQRKQGLALALAKAAPAKTPAAKAKTTRIAPTTAVKPAATAATKAVATAPAPTAIGKWRVQLGAFSKRASAEALFRQLGSALPGRQAYYISVGAITRLQAGPFASKAEAAAACARLSGKPCFPVAPR